MLTLDQFNYYLPKELIAQKPKPQRDQSRLLTLNKESGKINHHHFYDLPELLKRDDVLVRNNTKVIPARILGQKDTGGQVEILLTKRLSTNTQDETWECLTKPGLKPNQKVIFKNSDLTASCIEVTGYTRRINFNKSQSKLFVALEEIGHTPIPPYITWHEEDEPQLRQLYQTTYAKHQGSAAAPTAGLHFTSQLDQKLKDRGIKIIELTLHVGLGTFLPVKEQDVTQHQMHGERFILSEGVAHQLNQAKQAGQRIISVGTTSTRVLESCVKKGKLIAQTGETELYVYPPYKFQFIDGLITNFHLPQSTLLMLVSAFTSQPNNRFKFTEFKESIVGKAYREAVDRHYRFYSFGDAMLIN